MPAWYHRRPSCYSPHFGLTLNTKRSPPIFSTVIHLSACVRARERERSLSALMAACGCTEKGEKRKILFSLIHQFSSQQSHSHFFSLLSYSVRECVRGMEPATNKPVLHMYNGFLCQWDSCHLAVSNRIRWAACHATLHTSRRSQRGESLPLFFFLFLRESERNVSMRAQ